ncbi:precorrin-8X methylmutase [mine drainage metagenome]|uniref:Precorrin-8X methylmutase n=1 Tax=mine drainage metagenome TaxID=410659 RepID=A0A1J5Q6A8_9ZZZZ
MSRDVIHQIETESYKILRSHLDTSNLPHWTRAVVERVIHASADLDFVDDLICIEDDLARGAAALRGGAPIVADVQMVAAGVTSRSVTCLVQEAETTELARQLGLTRSAAAIHRAFEKVGKGAIWVVGCAPTALFEIVRLDVAPALVIGLPVGFVGAAESKARLRESGLPQVSNVSMKGGSAVAAAALNALLYTDASDA